MVNIRNTSLLGIFITTVRRKRPNFICQLLDLLNELGAEKKYD
jgi:hypothetical protein